MKSLQCLFYRDIWIRSAANIKRLEKDSYMEKIILDSEEGEEISFFVIDETKLNGVQYLLVSEQDPDNSEDEEGDATIMKCVTEEGDDCVYEFVTDDAEWDAVISVFSELLDEVDIEE